MVTVFAARLEHTHRASAGDRVRRGAAHGSRTESVHGTLHGRARRPDWRGVVAAGGRAPQALQPCPPSPGASPPSSGIAARTPPYRGVVHWRWPCRCRTHSRRARRRWMQWRTDQHVRRTRSMQRARDFGPSTKYLRAQTMENEHAEQEMALGMRNGARSKVRARSERFDGPGSDC